MDYKGCSDEEIEGWTLWGGAGDAFAERRKWRLNVVDARTNVPLEVRLRCLVRFRRKLLYKREP